MNDLKNNSRAFVDHHAIDCLLSEDSIPKDRLMEIDGVSLIGKLSATECKSQHKI
jgi:hypothetical protein